jgi:ABC-2 type transport system ATP-binding protein
VGRYSVRVAEFEAVALPALEPRPEVQLLVDEIGKMECLSPGFVAAARRALSSPVPLLGTVAVAGDGFIAEAKRAPGVQVFAITRENSDRPPPRRSRRLSPGTCTRERPAPAADASRARRRSPCQALRRQGAVDGVSFHVARNEIVGLLGPYGAGKMTAIGMILGFLDPTEGTVHVEGLDLAASRSQVLARSHSAAVYAPLPGNLTIRQDLRVFGLLYGVAGLSRRIDELLDQFGLRELRDTKCGLLSSGEQTRVGLAKAMLTRPRLLRLDEPTASLDPAVARDVRARIHDFATRGEGGVLWTSQDMREVAEVCDCVRFLSRGRILLEGHPRALPRFHGQATLKHLFVAVPREPLTLERA